MNLKDYIERAEAKAGSQKALSEMIGQTEGNIRGAKSGTRGMPAYACVLIADLIGEDEILVIAASELATEKHENRRAIWRKKLETVAAMGILASVISFVTPPPAQAAQLSQVIDSTLYIMLNLKRKMIKAFSSIRKTFFPLFRFAD
jgi:hypothetical protein